MSLISGITYAAIGFVRDGRFSPSAREKVLPLKTSHEPIPTNTPFTVLCWNLQYGAGRERWFFYDGGRATRVPDSLVHATMSGITELILQAQPDIAILQEVDVASDRTDRIDQLQWLVDTILPGSVASTPYYRVPYVPYPSHEHLGQVEMHLAILSRYAILNAVRYQLPLLREHWVRQQFNLKRAILSLSLPADNGEMLQLMNTHFSAFSLGDGTLDEQVSFTNELLRSQTSPWILCGDFNCLAPGDNASRLGFASQYYPEARTPIMPLFEHRSVVGEYSYRVEPDPYRTYVPYGTNTPDRTLDYGFVSPHLEVQNVEVLSQGARWSDHLPLLFTLILKS